MVLINQLYLIQLNSFSVGRDVQKSHVLGFLLFCYLLVLELIFETLNLNYHFFADDMVFYFVSTNIGTQDCFDSVISTPQEWFNGLKLQLNTRKVRIFEYCLDDSMVCVFQSPMDSKIFDIVNSIAFVIADTLAISKKVTLVCAGCYYNVTAKGLICTVKI